MMIKKLFAVLFTLSLLVCSVFAIGASAEGDGSLKIASYNISYEGDFKFMVAVPKAQLGETVTFTVTEKGNGSNTKSNEWKVSDLENDAFNDPVLGGEQMIAMRSDMQISAKDMAQDYILTVSSNGNEASVTYSLAMYLNERLYKNGVILADEGTLDADRRDLYLATLEYGHNAEDVLYNTDDDDSNDVTVFVDELVYSNISGKYQLYAPGSTVNSPSGFFKVSGFSYADGKWSKNASISQLTGAEVTLNSHKLYTTELVESFKDGQLKTSFITPKLTYKGADGNYVHQELDSKGNLVDVPNVLNVTNGYYTADNGSSLTDAAGNIYYDKFSLVKSFQGRSSVLRIQNLTPVEYDENEEPIEYRNNAQFAVPYVQSAASDSLKTNDVFVYEFDINIQTATELQKAGYQLVIRDTSGNAMYNLTLVNKGVLLYQELTPGGIVDFEQTTVNTELANLIFDKNWHNIRVEIGFNFRYTKVYVDDVLQVEYFAGLHNDYDYYKDVESRRSFGAAELFVANDYAVDVYVDNVIFTKYDKPDATILDANVKPTLVTATDLPEDVKQSFITNSGITFGDGTDSRIVIGRVEGDDASLKAYETLSKGIPEHYDIDSGEYVEYEVADGYVIIAIDNAIAIAYTNAYYRDVALAKFIEDIAGETIKVTEGTLASEYDADTERVQMYDSYLTSLLSTLNKANVENASEIVDQISNLYGNLYSGEILTWIASLYDPQLGGFYYSNSGKYTIGFQPDLESTSQATAMLERLGIVSTTNSNFYYTTLKTLKDENGNAILDEDGNPVVDEAGTQIYNTMLNWLRGLQKEDGCFYHPQWEGLDMAASRIGRDIDSAIHLFGRLEARPYYDIPGTTDEQYQGIGAPATPAALTYRLEDAKASSVSKIIALNDSSSSATSTLPTYLQSMENWADYLAGLGFNETGKSYPAGNTISSIHRLVTQADLNYAANPTPSTLAAYEKYIPNYATTTTPYVDYLENYVNSLQQDNGFWEAGEPTWAGLNGLMKISAAYGSYGRSIQKSYTAFCSALKVAKITRSGSESACYIFNAWTCLSSMLGTMSSNINKLNESLAAELAKDEAERDAALIASLNEQLATRQTEFNDSRTALLEAAPSIIANSYDVYSHHALRTGDGSVYGFSYYENDPMNYSQGSPVGYSDVPEADINSTMLATSSFLSVLFSSLNYAVDDNLTDGKALIKSIPLWNYKRDLKIFIDAWKAAPIADKSIPQPELITFDDGEIPSSVRVGVGSTGNTMSVESKDGDNALKLHYEKPANQNVESASYVNTYVKFVDQLAEGNTYYVEMDIYVDGDNLPNDALFMQYLLLDATETTDITAFNLFKTAAGIKIGTSYRHAGNGGTEEHVFTGIPATGGWIKLRFTTTKTYTDDVLTGLSTEVTVTGNDATDTYVFDDCFAFNTKTTDIDNDLVDVNVGRAWIVQYRQAKHSYDMWLDNIWCGKTAPTTAD